MLGGVKLTPAQGFIRSRLNKWVSVAPAASEPVILN